MPGILTPDCPLCHQPPIALLGGGTQAICGTSNCRVFIWNPQRGLDQLAEANFISLPEREA